MKFLQGLGNVPFWGFVSHHLPISVGDEISPIVFGDVKHNGTSIPTPVFDIRDETDMGDVEGTIRAARVLA